MSHGGWFRVTAALALLCAFCASHAAVPQGMVVKTHLKYSDRSLAEPALRSSAALVIDTTHSSVLYSRRSAVALPIASITKLMTSLVVMDAGQPLDEELTVTSEDSSTLGKRIISRLAPGTRLSRGDLMHLALMASENRAAHALASNYPGGVTACVAAMNAKARELGMSSAHFVEPTGLSDENVASPEDLSKLVMAAAKVPEIRDYSTDTDYEVQVGRHVLRFRNTDSLVTKADWKIEVQKTGYISRAGRCLVMQTVIEDRTIVIVLLNSYGKRTRVADARRIRKWMEATVAHEPVPATS